MLGHKLGIHTRNNKILAAVVRWVLNVDASQVLGKTYTWIDASAWADAQKWKD